MRELVRVKGWRLASYTDFTIHSPRPVYVGHQLIFKLGFRGKEKF